MSEPIVFSRPCFGNAEAEAAAAVVRCGQEQQDRVLNALDLVTTQVAGA